MKSSAKDSLTFEGILENQS